MLARLASPAIMRQTPVVARLSLKADRSRLPRAPSQITTLLFRAAESIRVGRRFPSLTHAWWETRRRLPPTEIRFSDKPASLPATIIGGELIPVRRQMTFAVVAALTSHL